MEMYQKDSDKGVLVEQSQVETLKKAGWTTEPVKTVTVEQKPVAKKVETKPVVKAVSKYV